MFESPFSRAEWKEIHAGMEGELLAWVAANPGRTQADAIRGVCEAKSLDLADPYHAQAYRKRIAALIRTDRLTAVPTGLRSPRLYPPGKAPDPPRLPFTQPNGDTE